MISLLWVIATLLGGMYLLVVIGLGVLREARAFLKRCHESPREMRREESHLQVGPPLMDDRRAKVARPIFDHLDNHHSSYRALIGLNTPHGEPDVTIREGRSSSLRLCVLISFLLILPRTLHAQRKINV